MLRLGLAWKPRLGLGSPGLWLHFPQAQAQAVEEGLGWVGLGSSRGLPGISPICYTSIVTLLSQIIILAPRPIYFLDIYGAQRNIRECKNEPETYSMLGHMAPIRRDLRHEIFAARGY
jgi:hypothetical protein